MLPTFFRDEVTGGAMSGLSPRPLELPNPAEPSPFHTIDLC